MTDIFHNQVLFTFSIMQVFSFGLVCFLMGILACVFMAVFIEKILGPSAKPVCK